MQPDLLSVEESLREEIARLKINISHQRIEYKVKRRAVEDRYREAISNINRVYDESISGITQSHLENIRMIEGESKRRMKRVENNVIVLLIWIKGKIDEHDIHCEYDEDDWALGLENIIRLLASEFSCGYDYVPEARFLAISMEELWKEVTADHKINTWDAIQGPMHYTIFGKEYPAIY